MKPGTWLKLIFHLIVLIGFAFLLRNHFIVEASWSFDDYQINRISSFLIIGSFILSWIGFGWLFHALLRYTSKTEKTVTEVKQTEEGEGEEEAEMGEPEEKEEV